MKRTITIRKESVKKNKNRKIILPLEEERKIIHDAVDRILSGNLLVKNTSSVANSVSVNLLVKNSSSVTKPVSKASFKITSSAKTPNVGGRRENNNCKTGDERGNVAGKIKSVSSEC